MTEREMAEFDSRDTGSLSGIRVLDLSRLVAGNMITHMLADHGAEVIKIERPGVGDELRRFGHAGTWWKEYSRSKKSLTLNLKSDKGREILFCLARKCDVMTESSVPGTMERLGLAPEAFLEANPDLVILRVSGWGQTGPFSSRPGFGTLVEAYSGLAAMTGFDDKPPLLPPLALADMIAGLTGFGAISSALVAREQGRSRGQVIDLSLFEPLFNVLGPWVATYAATGYVPRRLGNRADVVAPRNAYRASDGKWLAMSASTQPMWEKLAHAIGRGDLIEEPRFLTNAARVQHADELDDVVGGFIGARTGKENLDFFASAGITVGPIHDPSELVTDDYVLGRGVIEDFPDADFGKLPMHAPFPRFSETPANIRAPAPEIGEHAEEILEWLGFDADSRKRLGEAGVV